MASAGDHIIRWYKHIAIRTDADGRPLQGDLGFTAINFFQYMIGIMIIVFCSLAYKLIFRTKWVNPGTADCVTGRRTLSVEEIKELDEYYRLPGWRRFGTYVELW